MSVGIFFIDNCFQLVIENGTMKDDPGLETSVNISLFSDKRVTDNELPAGITDKRGWWGDMFPSKDGDQIGSKFWTLGRAKTVITTLAQIENFALDALNWMIEDGVAASITALAAFDSRSSSITRIVITRPDGEESRFDLFWDEQELLRA